MNDPAAADLRRSVIDAMVEKWRERAGQHVTDSPEGHVSALVDAGLAQIEGQLAALLADRERLVLATEFTVSVLPRDHIDHGHFSVTVEWRGDGRWAVINRPYCLGADGEWDYEMRPSAREDDWLATHRFDLETALRLAHEVAPGLTVNGITAAQAAERAGRPR